MSLETYQTEDGTHYANEADARARLYPLGRYLVVIPGERYNDIVASETTGDRVRRGHPTRELASGVYLAST